MKAEINPKVKSLATNYSLIALLICCVLLLVLRCDSCLQRREEQRQFQEMEQKIQKLEQEVQIILDRRSSDGM